MLKNKILKHYLFFLFLIAYIFLGLLIFKDFGVTDDEFPERKASNDLVRYLETPTSSKVILSSDYNYKIEDKKGHHPLISKYQRSYQYLQSKLNLGDSYEIDHLINILFSSLFFITIYLLFYFHYKSIKYGLIAVAFLFLLPRLVGDIPTNNKDVPFALMYLLSISAIYFESKLKLNSYLSIIILGVCFGFLQTFRGIGFSIYIVYIIYTLLYKDKNYINHILKIISIALISITFSILFFPWLGSNLLSNLPEFLFNSKNFQNWDGEIIFNGHEYHKDDRPWYYLFSWIIITTPIATQLLSIYSVFKTKILYKNELFSISLITIFVNFSLYLILQPTIYNALRHFLFLLPSITILAVIGLIHLLKEIQNTLKFVLIGLITINALCVINSYILLHPYQYIYFNEFIGGLKGANNKFETDYWGATYKDAADWIKEDAKEKSKVYLRSCNNNKFMVYFNENDKYEYYTPNINKPTYIVCDSGERLSSKASANTEIVFEIKRMGVTLNTIRKTKN
jgi:hypothetical protein